MLIISVFFLVFSNGEKVSSEFEFNPDIDNFPIPCEDDPCELPAKTLDDLVFEKENKCRASCGPDCIPLCTASEKDCFYFAGAKVINAF
jgi:hypothetical protein